MKRLYPIYVNRMSPCYARDHLGNNGCNARNDIPRFLYLMELRRFEEAFYVLKDTNPFSSGCGRFCDHPCETACNRGYFDEPVDIRSMERFISDWGFERGLKPKDLKEYNGRSVAIIGSGPAGLSAAYFLGREGYKVTVFEKHEQPGGLLTQGIPAYRYPRHVFQNELNYIKAAGVEIELNADIDQDRFIDIAEEYDAVIVATGAHRPGEIGCPGEDVPGVENGVHFLRDANFGHADRLNVKEGERIAVLGGGYTAIDVARVAVRLGAKPSIIYRRTPQEMTAHPGEVDETGREGVEFSFLRQATGIEKKKDGLSVSFQVMKLGPVDASGRSSPVPIPQKFETVMFDRVVLCVGDKPDLTFVGESFTIEHPKLICPDLPAELRERIFIAGDASMGSGEPVGMVVRAVGQAQDVTKAVRSFLGEDLGENTVRDIALYDTINKKYFDYTARMVEETLPFDKRKGNFEEVVQGIDADMAAVMASRCFNCGICIQCDWCWHYSNGSIVKLNTEWDSSMDATFYRFLEEDLQDATYKSVEACPRAALSVIKDGHRFEDMVDEQFIDEEKLDKGVRYGE